MKDVRSTKFVSRRFALFTIIIALFAFTAHSAYYTRPFGTFNCLYPPGSSNHIIVSAPTVYPTGALITKVTMTGTRSSASNCTVTWVVKHVASGRICRMPFNANGASTDCFDDLPADSQWEVWIECGPPPANCSVATVTNGQIRVDY